jgi:hypothetical protein
VAVATQVYSPELRHLLFQVQVVELHPAQLLMEHPAVVAALIKMAAKQVPPVLPVEVEPTLRVVLVQQEMPVVQQMDPFLLMVLIFKVAHRVTKPMQKVAAVAVVVITAVAVVPIKLQVEDQKMAAAEVAPATLTQHAEL